jgi:hypothetical protein
MPEYVGPPTNVPERVPPVIDGVGSVKPLGNVALSDGAPKEPVTSTALLALASADHDPPAP